MRSSGSVFISYANEDRALAYKIDLCLRDHGLKVFFDRDQLPDGSGYHARIAREIKQCSAFIFLISPHSFAAGRYTMTELNFARDKWRHPKDHVLPVLVTEPGMIDSNVHDLWDYIMEASLVRAKGHVAAEVSQRVVEMLERSALMPKVTGSLRSLNVFNYFKGGAGKSIAYANSDLDEDIFKRARERGGRISVAELKAKLSSRSILRRPQCLTVTGRFFPTALLSFGWWDRVHKDLDREVQWKDPALQQWLFSGFEQWAPSWDLNDWSNDKPFNLIGQIGENDEADSIPVLVKSEHKAKKIRELMGSQLVVNANVVGCLCHESHLRTLPTLGQEDTAFLESIKELSSAQYYLVLQDSEESHTVEPLVQSADYYSGYIWQCWAPQEWVPAQAYDTRLPGAYFVWEHTNFADPDVIRYGLDSMDRKVGYLRKRLRERLSLSGELVLLQHLMPSGRLRGDDGDTASPPAISTEHFRRLFQHRGDVQVAA